MKQVIFVLLFSCSALFAVEFEEEVIPVKIGEYGSVQQIQLACSVNGRGAVVLVLEYLRPTFYNSELFAHQVLPLVGDFKVKKPVKLDTTAKRAQHFDIAFDSRTQKFLAVWSELILFGNSETSAIFYHRFATNGNRIGGRKPLLKSPNYDYIGPLIVNEVSPNANSTWKMVYTRKNPYDEQTSGLFMSSIDERGEEYGSPLQLIKDDFVNSRTVHYYLKKVFMRPNGVVVVGLTHSYYNKKQIRWDDTLSLTVRKNGSVIQGKPFFHVRDDASFTEQYAFGQASSSNFSAATLDPLEGTGGYFWRYRANQTRIKGRYRISSDTGGNAIAMVSDYNFHLYCLIQKDNGILVIPFDRSGKAVLNNQIFFTFSGANASGTYIAAAYNSRFNALMVVFQDNTEVGSPLYIAYLPLALG